MSNEVGKCRVIAVTLQKGGTGKTTTAVNLAEAFVKMGRRVLLVDTDPQCNASNLYGISDEEKRREEAGEEGLATLYDMLEGSASIVEVIYHTSTVDLIPSDKALKLPEYEATNLFNIDNMDYLKDALDKVRAKYDYVFIDTPPSTGFMMMSSLTAADGVIIPFVGEVFSVNGISDMLATLKDIRNLGYNTKIKNYGVLLTQYRKDQAGHRNIYSLFKEPELLKFPTFDTPIRFSKTISAAQEDRESIYSSRYAKTLGAEDYMKVARELEEKISEEEGEGRDGKKR